MGSAIAFGRLCGSGHYTFKHKPVVNNGIRGPLKRRLGEMKIMPVKIHGIQQFD